MASRAAVVTRQVKPLLSVTPKDAKVRISRHFKNVIVVLNTILK